MVYCVHVLSYFKYVCFFVCVCVARIELFIVLCFGDSLIYYLFYCISLIFFVISACMFACFFIVYVFEVRGLNLSVF